MPRPKITIPVIDAGPGETHHLKYIYPLETLLNPYQRLVKQGLCAHIKQALCAHIAISSFAIKKKHF